MTEIKLVAPDDPILRKFCDPIQGDKIPEGLRGDLWQTLARYEALGVAAPQIGVSLPAAVVAVNGVVLELVNSKIEWISEETTSQREGCISLPGVFVDVIRAKSIKLWTDPVVYTGLIARVIQHEIDHLHGILITDYKYSG